MTIQDASYASRFILAVQLVFELSFNRAEVYFPSTPDLFKFCTLDAQAAVKFSGKPAGVNVKMVLNQLS